MWLRSEKRSSRGSHSTPKSSLNLRKIIKEPATLKKLKATAAAGRRGAHLKSAGQNIDARQSPSKCNISKIRAKVKRLGKRNVSAKLKPNKRAPSPRKASTAATTSITSSVSLSRRRARYLSRNLLESGKENRWQDGAPEEITLYAVDSRNGDRTADGAKEPNSAFVRNAEAAIESGDGLSNDDALNNFGPIMVNADADNANRGECGACGPCKASSAVSSTNKTNNCINNMKCISECDSTTDYERQQMPSTSTAVAVNVASQAEVETLDSEIDSTTDLLPAEPMSVTPDTSSEMLTDGNAMIAATAVIESSASRSDELPKLTISPTNTSNPYQSFPTLDLSPTNKQYASDSSTAIASGSNTIANFPTPPDLISLFDEDMNKGSTDMGQYSDFFPYNNVITQALLSCNEVSNLCEQNDLTNNLSTDITFLTSINQTAIDNLKALTNLQNHTTNFLSGITLPKTSTSYNEQMMGANNSMDADNNMIHSMATAACSLYSHQQAVNSLPENSNQQLIHQVQPQSQNVNGTNDIQLETDECMDIEEINVPEELAWDAFDPYVFIKHLPPLTAEMRAKCPALPLKTRSSPEFNLVLDLDETLVHCSLQELSDASFKFPVLFQASSIPEWQLTGRKPANDLIRTFLFDIGLQVYGIRPDATIFPRILGAGLITVRSNFIHCIETCLR